jgi:hypothetical protein
MIANPATNLTRLELAQPLVVRLLKEPSGPPLAIEPVHVSDLADVASEGWRDVCLRAGHPDLPLSEVPMRLSPVLGGDSGSRCAGFELEVALPDGTGSRRRFPFSCLRHVADRAVAALLEAGVLKVGESYLYEVALDPEGASRFSSNAGGLAAPISVRCAALTYLNLALRPLLERARPVDLQEEEVFPVFYTQEALSKAEASARQGIASSLESGAALLGSLAVCPDSGEFFALVRDVIEIQDAEATNFSLAYSSRSWLRLQNIQRARQAAYPHRAERLLGQAHGHPFRPNDGRVCAQCDKRATCTLTSAWASQEDQAWHRAVFARQPWAVCHIFGLTAREEIVNQLLGLKEGRLQNRGYYVLPSFPLD